MQQRIIIAIALACNPEIVIADEPTTALDVTIQAQILDLICDLQAEKKMGLILITHNMGVVVRMCEKILVMYGGVVVEQGTTRDIFKKTLHPYTGGLLATIPGLNGDQEELYSIPGYVPKFTYPVKQCRFCNRCTHAIDRCRMAEPPLFEITDGHWSRCWLHQSGNEVSRDGA